MDLTLEITSSVAENDGGEKILKQFADACRQHNFVPAVQLHNTVTENAVKKICDCGLAMSAHAPVVGDFSLNLATEKNLDVIFNAFEANADFCRKHNISKSVFHGFSMCDDLIPRMKTQQDYVTLLKKSCPEKYLMQGTWLNIDYSNCEEYNMRQKILTANLAKLRRRITDITFCIENDMPIYGYSNMKLSQMIDYKHPVCVDIGHLYSSSLLFGFDFLTELEYGIQNLDVQMVHFHNSKMSPEIPKEKLSDGHQKLTMPSAMNWQEALKILLKHNASNFILEIGKADADDVHAFAEIADKCR